jgi:hypothetical protein
MEEISVVLTFVGKIAIPVLLFVLGMLYRIESKRSEDIEKYHAENMKEHQDIRKEITDQHAVLRDKIEQIWQHMKS